MERYGPLAFTALLLLAGIGLVFAFAQRTAPASTPIAIHTPQPSTPPSIKVYVIGAVAQPGVYALQDGDRVEEAIQAAGGPTADADLARMNLATRVRDEARVYVPRIGETPAAGGAAPAADAGKININTAPASLLETLPGIGQVRAQNIVNYRQKNGPFRQVTDLQTAKLVPASAFEQIKGLITVD